VNWHCDVGLGELGSRRTLLSVISQPTLIAPTMTDNTQSSESFRKEYNEWLCRRFGDDEKFIQMYKEWVEKNKSTGE